MQDTSHLVAITERLSRERARLAEAKTPYETKMRSVWVAQAENELAREFEFLGMESILPEMSNDDLLAELMS